MHTLHGTPFHHKSGFKGYVFFISHTFLFSLLSDILDSRTSLLTRKIQLDIRISKILTPLILWCANNTSSFSLCNLLHWGYSQICPLVFRFCWDNRRGGGNHLTQESSTYRYSITHLLKIRRLLYITSYFLLTSYVSISHRLASNWLSISILPSAMKITRSDYRPPSYDWPGLLNCEKSGLSVNPLLDRS